MNTSKIRQVLFYTILFGFWINPLAGQELEDSKKRSQLSIEIDPATFAFEGYGLHVRYSPEDCTHLLFGVGVYAMNMPDELVNFNSRNKDMGWDVRLDNGLGIFAEHHFSTVNSGWFAGLQSGIQEYEISLENPDRTEGFTNLLLMSYGGYTWQWENGIYIKPWAGFGYTSKISGSNSIGEKEYDIAPLAMFATLHIGYSF